MNNTSLYPHATVTALPRWAKVAVKARRIMALFGQGGIGKTTVCKTVIAPALGIDPDDVIVVNFNGATPQEVLGYGVPPRDGTGSRDMWFSVPPQLPTVERVGSARKLFVLDEFTSYDPEVRALCRSMFNPFGEPGTVGSHILGPNVIIALTGNLRAHGSAGSGMLDAPIVERCMVAELKPDINQWLTWAATEGLHESPVYGFLAFHAHTNTDGTVDHFCPPIPQPWTGAQHPCPRTWEAAALATAGQCDEDNDDRLTPDELSLVLRSTVGEAAGQACYAFTQLLGTLLPKVAAIRDGRADLPVDPQEQYACVFAALRVAKRELLKSRDPEVFVAGGQLDWLVDRFLVPARRELKAFAFTTATRNGIPLDLHAKRSEIQALGV